MRSDRSIKPIACLLITSSLAILLLTQSLKKQILSETRNKQYSVVVLMHEIPDGVIIQVLTNLYNYLGFAYMSESTN